MDVPNIVNIHLNSQDARIIEPGLWRFHLHDPISLVGKYGNISLISFQAVNSIYNITDANNTLNNYTFSNGFYKDADLLALLKPGLGPSITVSFNKQKLKFLFTSNTPFILSGSILKYLNINELISLFDSETQLFRTESYRCFDLYQRAHSVNVIIPNIRTSNNTQVENSSAHHLNTRIGKFNIDCDFGEYIAYSSDTTEQNKSILNEESISRIDVKLKNDYNEDIFIDDDFTLSLRIEIINSNAETTDDGYLNSLQNDSGEIKTIGGNGLDYPIVNQIVSILKTSRNMRNEKLYRNIYLKSQGLKEEVVDAIENKLKEILEKIRK